MSCFGGGKTKRTASGEFGSQPSSPTAEPNEKDEKKREVIAAGVTDFVPDQITLQTTAREFAAIVEQTIARAKEMNAPRPAPPPKPPQKPKYAREARAAARGSTRARAADRRALGRDVAGEHRDAGRAAEALQRAQASAARAAADDAAREQGLRAVRPGDGAAVRRAVVPGAEGRRRRRAAEAEAET